MGNFTRHWLNQRMNNERRMRMEQGEMQNHKFGFGNDDEMQNRGREYRSEYRARSRYNGGYRGEQGDFGYDARNIGYDERYRNDMQDYRNERRGY